MFFFIWNVLEVIFDNDEVFYEGKSLDEVIMYLYKMNQYVGMSLFLIYFIYDVVKYLNIDYYKYKLKNYVVEVFGIGEY